MPARAGLGDYIKRAFLWRWNLLLLAGSLAGAFISPWADGLVPLILAGEAAFLAALISTPRFRDAVDAEAHAKRATPGEDPLPVTALTQMLESLPADGRRRFQALRARCLEMQKLAAGARGNHPGADDTGDELRRGSLDRLLWIFLRLLVSQDSLRRFLESTSEDELTQRVDGLRRQLEAAQTANHPRLVASLTDSVSIAQLRLDNHKKAQDNANFVTVELDRIESKIQTLTELVVNRQDPDLLTNQVDAAAASLQDTESTIQELQQITGLADQLHEPPPILDSDLSKVLQR